MKFKIIYADPPWRYRDKTVQGAAEKYYKTLSLKDLKDLPVPDIVDRDSVLFLWMTNPLTPEGLELMESWGFTYRDEAFTWLKLSKTGRKLHFGLGRWTRGGTETCSLGFRGNMEQALGSAFQDREKLLEYPIQGHSAKPPVVRDKIVEWVGDVPRIELFARNRTKFQDGWVNLGNEVDGQNISDALNQVINDRYFSKQEIDDNPAIKNLLAT